jgi:hypothetical protein
MISAGVEKDLYGSQVRAVPIRRRIEIEPAMRRKYRSKLESFIICLVLGINLPNLLRISFLNFLAFLDSLD